MRTIERLPDPAGGPITWAVCEQDGSVSDRYETADAAQKDYPDAVVVRDEKGTDHV